MVMGNWICRAKPNGMPGTRRRGWHKTRPRRSTSPSPKRCLKSTAQDLKTTSKVYAPNNWWFNTSFILFRLKKCRGIFAAESMNYHFLPRAPHDAQSTEFTLTRVHIAPEYLADEFHQAHVRKLFQHVRRKIWRGNILPGNFHCG